MSATTKLQICESCKGKYSVDQAFCPYCHHKSTLRQHTEGVKYSLEQERTMIGVGGGVLLGAACLLALWVFKYQGAEIEYRVLGRTDFKFTVQTSVLRRDGAGLRFAGTTTYWYKPGHLRLDLISSEDPTARALTRVARLGKSEMYTVDAAAGIYFTQSYSSEAMQAPSVSGTSWAPAAWTHASPTQPRFSLLGSFETHGQVPQVQLIQAPAQTPAAPSGPTRNYKLEKLGQKSLNGIPTIHYRLTTAVNSRGCAGLGNGQEVTDYWVAPNLNGRFFEEEAVTSSSSGASSGSNWDDETVSPTATPDPKAAPTPTPTALPVAAPKTGSGPLPIPTPYSPATAISMLRVPLVLVPNPPDACAVGNVRIGEEADFQTLFNGMILQLRQYRGSTVVMEQKVKKFKRLQLEDEIFSVNRYTPVDAANFWARRAAPLPKGAATPKA